MRLSPVSLFVSLCIPLASAAAGPPPATQPAAPAGRGKPALVFGPDGSIALTVARNVKVPASQPGEPPQTRRAVVFRLNIGRAERPADGELHLVGLRLAYAPPGRPTLRLRADRVVLVRGESAAGRARPWLVRAEGGVVADVQPPDDAERYGRVLPVRLTAEKFTIDLADRSATVLAFHLAGPAVDMTGKRLRLELGPALGDPNLLLPGWAELVALLAPADLARPGRGGWTDALTAGLADLFDAAVAAPATQPAQDEEP